MEIYSEMLIKTEIKLAHGSLCWGSIALEFTCVVCVESIMFSSVSQEQWCMVRLCSPPPWLHRAVQRISHLNQSRNIKQMMKSVSDAVTAARFYRLSSRSLQAGNKANSCNHSSSAMDTASTYLWHFVDKKRDFSKLKTFFSSLTSHVSLWSFQVRSLIGSPFTRSSVGTTDARLSPTHLLPVLFRTCSSNRSLILLLPLILFSPLTVEKKLFTNPWALRRNFKQWFLLKDG